MNDKSSSSLPRLLRRADLAEVIVGANVLAFPIAATEEIWNLSEELTFLQVTAFAPLSCVFLSLFIHYMRPHDNRVGTVARLQANVL